MGRDIIMRSETTKEFEDDIVTILKKHKILRDDIKNFVMGIDIKILANTFPVVDIKMGLPILDDENEPSKDSD